MASVAVISLNVFIRIFCSSVRSSTTARRKITMPDWAATLICPDNDFAGTSAETEFLPEPGTDVQSATLHLKARGASSLRTATRPESAESRWSTTVAVRYQSYALRRSGSRLHCGDRPGNGWFRGRLLGTAAVPTTA